MYSWNSKVDDKPNNETNKIIRRVKKSCTLVLEVTYKERTIETFP